MASLGQGQGIQGGGFGVYQHAAISSALSAMSVRPSRRDIIVIVVLSFLFVSLLATLTSRYIALYILALPLLRIAGIVV